MVLSYLNGYLMTKINILQVQNIYVTRWTIVTTGQTGLDKV